jgi:Fe2+ or Zn2+ uptake regulation protein
MRSLAEWEKVAAERARVADEAKAAADATRSACRAGMLPATALTGLSRQTYQARRAAKRAAETVQRLTAAQAGNLSDRASVAGIRRTSRRNVLFEVLEAAASEGEILLAEDILARARAFDPRATLGAVRRGLKGLRKAGLVTRKFTAVGTLAGYRLPEADATHPVPTPAEMRAAMRRSTWRNQDGDGNEPARVPVAPGAEDAANFLMAGDAPR